jgi:hypothetical protein
MSDSFNQKLPILSDSLQYLILGTNFSQKILHLPKELILFSVGEYFSQCIKRLPNKLKLLSWHCNMKPTQFPNSLKELKLYPAFKQKIYRLPESIQTVDFYGKYVHLIQFQ